MATNTGAFFVGVGTASAILAVGFGGGLILAKATMEPRAEQQARAPRENAPPVRVILPASAEPAQPPQSSMATAAEQVAPTPPAPIKEALVPEKTMEKVDTRKVEARERRKRQAERHAKRFAERAKRKQQIEQAEQRDAPIMAFGGDEHRQSSGFFGN